MYQPTHAPGDAVEARYGDAVPATAAIKEAIASIGSLTFEVTWKELDEAEAENLAALLDAYGQDSPEAAVNLVQAYGDLNAGQKVSLTESVTKVIALLAAFDRKEESTPPEHPFFEFCQGQKTKILQWLKNGGPKVCPTCGGPRHLTDKTAKGDNKYTETQRYNAISECLREHRARFFCPICCQLVHFDTKGEHVSSCADAYFSTAPATTSDMCKLKGKHYTDASAALWETFSFHLCPFRTCVDDRMAGRMREWPEELIHFQGTRCTKATGQQYPLAGKLASFTDRHTLLDHLVRHLFEAYKVEEEVRHAFRLCVKDDKLYCPIHRCDDIFSNDENGQLRLYEHLANHHLLRIFFNGSGKSLVGRLQLTQLPLPMPKAITNLLVGKESDANDSEGSSAGPVYHFADTKVFPQKRTRAARSAFEHEEVKRQRRKERNAPSKKRFLPGEQGQNLATAEERRAESLSNVRWPTSFD